MLSNPAHRQVTQRNPHLPLLIMHLSRSPHRYLWLVVQQMRTTISITRRIHRWYLVDRNRKRLPHVVFHLEWIVMQHWLQRQQQQQQTATMFITLHQSKEYRLMKCQMIFSDLEMRGRYFLNSFLILDVINNGCRKSIEFSFSTINVCFSFMVFIGLYLFLFSSTRLSTSIHECIQWLLLSSSLDGQRNGTRSSNGRTSR